MHRLVLCLLLVLLPLRSLLAAGHLTCEPMAAGAAQAQAPLQAGHAHHAHHNEQQAADHGQDAKPCKVCAPCCLAAAPPPVVSLDAARAVPSARVALGPAERWRGIVPPLPDPPPRA